MGCCLSTPNESNAKKQEQITSPPTPQKNCHQHQNVSKSPPRAEEEAVKEVLSVSETPKPKPESPLISPIIKTHPGFLQQTAQLSPNKPNTTTAKIPTLLNSSLLLNHKNPINEEETKYPKFLPDTNTATIKTKPVPPPTLIPLTPEEISEISDLCSLSEISVSTTTLSHTERRGEDGDQRSRDENEVCQPRVYRSPLKSSFHRNASGSGPMTTVGRDRVTGRSPVRRSDPSPTGRRNARVVTGQGGGFGAVDGRNGQRRDSGTGEQSSRRPTSPEGTNRNEVGSTSTVGGWNSRSNNLGRSPSGRKTGPSPNRVRMVQPRETGRRAEEIHQSGDRRKMKEGEEKWASSTSRTTTTTANNINNSSDRTTPDESIENPLVSLECFIFL